MYNQRPTYSPPLNYPKTSDITKQKEGQYYADLFFKYGTLPESTPNQIFQSPSKSSEEEPINSSLISDIFNSPQNKLAKTQPNIQNQKEIEYRRKQMLRKHQQTTECQRLSASKPRRSLPPPQTSPKNTQKPMSLIEATRDFINARFYGVDKEITLHQLEIILRYFTIIDKYIEEKPLIAQNIIPLCQIENSDGEELFDSEKLRLFLVQSLLRAPTNSFCNEISNCICSARMNGQKNFKNRQKVISANRPNINSNISSPSRTIHTQSTVNSPTRINSPDHEQSNFIQQITEEKEMRKLRVSPIVNESSDIIFIDDDDSRKTSPPQKSAKTNKRDPAREKEISELKERFNKLRDDFQSTKEKEDVLEEEARASGGGKRDERTINDIKEDINNLRQGLTRLNDDFRKTVGDENEEENEEEIEIENEDALNDSKYDASKMFGSNEVIVNSSATDRSRSASRSSREKGNEAAEEIEEEEEDAASERPVLVERNITEDDLENVMDDFEDTEAEEETAVKTASEHNSASSERTYSSVRKDEEGDVSRRSQKQPPTANEYSENSATSDKQVNGHRTHNEEEEEEEEENDQLQDLRSARRMLTDLTSQIQRLEAENRQLADDNSALKQENDRLLSDNGRLKSSREKSAASKKELASLSKQVIDLKRTNDSLKSDNDSLQIRNSDLSTRNKHLKSSNMQLTFRNRSLQKEQTKVADLTKQLELLEVDNIQLKRANDKLKSSNFKLTVTSRQLETNNMILNEANKSLIETSNVAESDDTKALLLTQQVKKLILENSKLATDNERLRNSNSQLEESNKQLQSESEQMTNLSRQIQKLSSQNNKLITLNMSMKRGNARAARKEDEKVELLARKLEELKTENEQLASLKRTRALVVYAQPDDLYQMEEEDES